MTEFDRPPTILIYRITVTTVKERYFRFGKHLEVLKDTNESITENLFVFHVEIQTDNSL